MNYRIVEKEEFKIVGIGIGLREDMNPFPVPSDSKICMNLSDEEVTDDVKKMFKTGDDGRKYLNFFAHDEHLCRAPLWRFGITRPTDNGEVLVIGVEADDSEEHNMIKWPSIPGGTWAVFTVKGKLQYKPDEWNQHIYREIWNSVISRRRGEKDSELLQPIDKTFARAEVEWMDKSGYERAGNYEMMVYPLGDTESDDYYCEAWIPVRKK